jgi:uncharacterized OsmC-like protein
MPESIIVSQDKQFHIEFWAQNPEKEESEFQRIEQITQLSPYGMMLASLAACTTIVLHTYAQHRHLDLESVEMRMRYDRIHSQDCKVHEIEEKFMDAIHEEILLRGTLSEAERQKLMVIARACPVYKLYKNSIPIHSMLLSTPGD